MVGACKKSFECLSLAIMTLNMSLPQGKKIYFASDFHLGSYPLSDSIERERRVIAWLDQVSSDAAVIVLLGDVFDFWFEYKTVVPKGYVRFLGKLAELSDRGIQLFFFKGNHDMWMFGYLKEELGATIISNECLLNCNGKRFYLHHGDGLGPGDQSYKFLKTIFRNPLCQWLFARIHPNLGIWIAQKWSKNSRISSGKKEEFVGAEAEWLVQFATEQQKKTPVDYFVFGHRHLPLDLPISGGSRYVNLGEWIHFNSYASFDGENLILETWQRSE